MPYNRNGRDGGAIRSGGFDAGFGRSRSRSKSARRRPGKRRRTAKGRNKAHADELRRMADRLDPPDTVWEDTGSGTRAQRIGWRV